MHLSKANYSKPNSTGLVQKGQSANILSIAITYWKKDYLNYSSYYIFHDVSQTGPRDFFLKKSTCQIDAW